MPTEPNRPLNRFLPLVLAFMMGCCVSYLGLLYVVALNKGYAVDNAHLRSELRQECSKLSQERAARSEERLQSLADRDLLVKEFLARTPKTLPPASPKNDRSSVRNTPTYPSQDDADLGYVHETVNVESN